MMSCETAELLQALNANEELAACSLLPGIPITPTSSNAQVLVAEPGGATTSSRTAIHRRWSQVIACSSGLVKTADCSGESTASACTPAADEGGSFLDIVPAPFPEYDPHEAASDLYDYLYQFEQRWVTAFTDAALDEQESRTAGLISFTAGLTQPWSSLGNEDGNDEASTATGHHGITFERSWRGRDGPPRPLFKDPIDCLSYGDTNIKEREEGSTTIASRGKSNNTSGTIDMDFRMPFCVDGCVLSCNIPRPLPISRRLSDFILSWESAFLQRFDDVDDGGSLKARTTVGCVSTRLLQLIHVANFLQADFLRALLLAKAADLLVT